MKLVGGIFMKFTYGTLFFLVIACSCVCEIEAEFSVPVKNETNTEVVVAYFRQYYGWGSPLVQESKPQTILPGQEITLGKLSVSIYFKVFVVGADKPEHLQQAADKGSGILVLKSANRNRDVSCPLVIKKDESGKLVLSCSDKKSV